MFVSENDYIKLMNNLNTQNPYNYKYQTKALEIHILGGIKTNKLETLRVTLSIQKAYLPTTSSQREENYNQIIRQSIDLYNDNLVEKLVRKCAERLEIGTSIVRQCLQELTRALENHRFLLLNNETENQQPTIKQLTAKEEKEAIKFLKSKGRK